MAPGPAPPAAGAAADAPPIVDPGPAPPAAGAAADAPPIVDEPTQPDELDHKWRIARWLSNRGVAEAVAYALIPELDNDDPNDDPDELEFARALARDMSRAKKTDTGGDGSGGVAAVRKLLDSNGLLDRLAKLIYDGAVELDAGSSGVGGVGRGAAGQVPRRWRGRALLRGARHLLWRPRGAGGRSQSQVHPYDPL